MAVGEAQELAPRDPDPEASYDWSILDAPEDSDLVLGDGDVETFAPDAAGLYTVGLEAPDGSHELTARVYPGEKAITQRPGRSGYSGYSGYSGVSGSGVSGLSGSGSGAGSGLGSRDGQPGRPRITLHGEQVGDEIVLTAETDTAPGAPDEDLAVEFYVDDRDDLENFESEGHEARVSLADIDGSVRVHAVAVGNQYSVPDTAELYADGGVDRLNEPPEWTDGMSCYELYVRGFVEPEDDQTVFEAITERLDYIQDLGLNTLWFTPVLQNDDFDHGYNITDFYSIADDLGGEEQFMELVEAAHDRGMKVLFDLVLNHSAREHEFYQRAEDGDPEYREWYEWEDEDNDVPGTYFDWPYIANFNYDTLAVRRHLLDAVEKWAEHVDGFRCDMAWAVPRPFWQEIRDLTKAQDGEFLLMDETIPYVADFHNLCFDVHFDAGLYFDLVQIGTGDQPADQIFDSIQNRYSVGFPNHAGFLTYIENHDETRYIEQCGEDAVRAAATASWTLPGIPMVYAGQEIGERQRRGHTHWEYTNEGLQDFHRDLARTWNEIDALKVQADFEAIDYESDNDSVTAFARDGEDGRYVVVLNFSGEAEVVGLDEEVDAVDQITGENVAAEDGVTVEDAVVLPAAN
ncbi:alpha-amylase [Halapricum sp. CBA1109]|uniref:alpha-amylase family glycosyl hydrolase n=1 Tax=Halapricum sp. CBA1109 TaxID=2668068 RepID=UPI0012FA431B|nr:alpha-amylase family glycosyl hydrolase [Halapricum sp. CBA1109]MUV88769.1 alpha-amylase [Halapricum sp. CBA1109]